MDFTDQVLDLIDAADYRLSNLLPSEWAESNRMMTTDVSPFPGKFSFKRTPYLREVLDTISPNHPAHTVAVMKGAQIGFSTGVIENGIGYIIAENPGNVLFLTGHSDLAEEAMSGKIDQMIDSCGLRPMIRPNVLRKRNQRTGDTSKSKEFPGGSLVAGSAGNHKLLRQRSVRFGFIDDFDAAKKSTKESGATTEMIEQRFAAYADKKKLYYISTPEVKQTSNIEPLFERGDQRRFHVPCPCCGDFISLHWSIIVDEITGGISYDLDENGELVDGSVGYVCQSCGDKFNDQHKHEMLLNGVWKPTAKPVDVGFYSYHLSSLYAPPGMYDWEHYVRQYLKANPINEPVREREMQTFVNLVLGETYEPKGKAPKATMLMNNIRDYQVSELPENLSMRDGNGRIVLLTLASDLNGKVDDARLDWELVAWSESGANYSVDQGSIGTFVPHQTQAQKDADDRVKWTYQHNMENSIWDSFQEIIEKIYLTDTGRRMQVFITGIDTGNTYMGAPYYFIENNNKFVVGLKGKDADKYRRFGMDTPSFRPAKERGDLYLLEVNQLKDELSEFMSLKWDGKSDQPNEFMNFPTPSKHKYQYKSFFSQYEGEHRVIEKNKDGDGVSSRWVKKQSNSQNHFWDCRVYNMALRDIIVDMVCKELKIKNGVWKDYVDAVTGER